MIRSIQIISVFFTVLIAYIGWAILSTPRAEKIKGCVTTKMYKVNLCESNSHYARLAEISPSLKSLIIIAEDASFYSHDGFDQDELKNSLATNISSKKFARGGSTITQQLAKNVFLTFEKSLSRKIREALITSQIERFLTKDKILEKYLNVIEFGPALFGIKPAANYYFNKDPASLNLLESAFLVFLVPNPKTHSKSFKSGALTPYARYRILDLSYRMYRFGKITSEQYLAAKDLVDEFPWTNLTNDQKNTLSGISYASDVPPISPEETPAVLPDEDTSLLPVEPPPESESAEEAPVEDGQAPFEQ